MLPPNIFKRVSGGKLAAISLGVKLEESGYSELIGHDFGRVVPSAGHSDVYLEHSTPMH